MVCVCVHDVGDFAACFCCLYVCFLQAGVRTHQRHTEGGGGEGERPGTDPICREILLAREKSETSVERREKHSLRWISGRFLELTLICSLMWIYGRSDAFTVMKANV